MPPAQADLFAWIDETGMDVLSGTITTAADRSGNGHDFTQAGTARPTRLDDAINGLAAFRCDGVDDCMICDVAGLNDMTVGILHRFNSLGAGFRSFFGARSGTAGPFDADIVGTSGTPSQSQYRGGAGDGSNGQLATSTGDAGDYVAGEWAITIVTTSGTTTRTVTLEVNGDEKPDGASANAPLARNRLVFGACYYNDTLSDHASMDIAAVLVFDRKLNRGERIQLGDYLNTIAGTGILPDWTELPTLDADSGAISSGAFDLDGDGNHEFISIAQLSSADPHFRVKRWDGNTYATVAEVMSAAEVSAELDRFGTGHDVADFLGTGRKDIVVLNSSNAGTTGTLYIFVNPGGDLSGEWVKLDLYPWSGVGVDANKITHADVKAASLWNNGRADVVVRDINGRIWIFRNTSAGGVISFAAPIFIQGTPREGLCLYDIAGAGRRDIVVNGAWIETPADPDDDWNVWPMDGAENFRAAAVTADSIADQAWKVEAGDFGGGNIGVVHANAEVLADNSPAKALGIHVLWRPADPRLGTWTITTLINTGKSWHNLALARLNGKLSVIAGISSVGLDTLPGRLSVWQGNGDGTFEAVEDIQTGTFVYSICVGRLDDKLVIFAPENWLDGFTRAYKRRR